MRKESVFFWCNKLRLRVCASRVGGRPPFSPVWNNPFFVSTLHFLFHLEPISPSCLVPRGNTLLGAPQLQREWTGLDSAKYWLCIKLLVLTTAHMERQYKEAVHSWISSLQSLGQCQRERGNSSYSKQKKMYVGSYQLCAAFQIGLHWRSGFSAPKTGAEHC